VVQNLPALTLVSAGKSSKVQVSLVSAGKSSKVQVPDDASTSFAEPVIASLSLVIASLSLVSAGKTTRRKHVLCITIRYATLAGY